MPLHFCPYWFHCWLNKQSGGDLEFNPTTAAQLFWLWIWDNRRYYLCFLNYIIIIFLVWQILLFFFNDWNYNWQSTLYTPREEILQPIKSCTMTTELSTLTNIFPPYIKSLIINLMWMHNHYIILKKNKGGQSCLFNNNICTF